MIQAIKGFVLRLIKGKKTMKPSDKKELEEIIRRAFEIDKILPNVIPQPPTSLIGKMIVIPDTERSIEDINEDVQRNRALLNSDDVALWEEVNEWFKGIDALNRAVVIKRCQGKGWKRIAKELVKEGRTYRYLHRATLWRHFNEGLEEILRMF
jgi:hypothetical protein